MGEGRVSKICRAAIRKAAKMKPEDELDERWLEFIACFSDLVENDPDYSGLSDQDLEVFFKESFVEYVQKEGNDDVKLSDVQRKQLWHNFYVDQHRLGLINTPKLQAKYDEVMRWETEGIVKPHVHDS